MQDDRQRVLLDAYFRHTREILPELGLARGWSATEESHFQRLVLDHVVGGVWYGKLREPAALSMSKSQLRKAVRLCEGLAGGSLDFEALNEESLAWRAAHGHDLREKQAAPEVEFAPALLMESATASATILAFPARPQTRR